MEGISSSDRARKLFERVVDIVTNDFVQERPNSLRTPHRDTSASQIGVSGSSSENSRLSARINSATPEYSRLFGFQSKRKDSKKDQKNNAKDGLRQRGFTTAFVWLYTTKTGCPRLTIR